MLLQSSFFLKGGGLFFSFHGTPCYSGHGARFREHRPPPPSGILVFSRCPVFVAYILQHHTTPPTRRWKGDGPWDRPVSVAVVGDLGLVNAGATFDRLHQLVDDNEIDFVLHLGDIGCEREL